MYWSLFLYIALALLLGAIIGAVIRANSKYMRNTIFEPSNILFVGVVLSSIILFIPIYVNTFKNSECGIFETVLIAIHNMIRLFIVDGEFVFITSNISGLPTWISRAYTMLFSVLFVLAPVLTFGFVLSFFKNISAYKKYIMHYNSEAYIFSELNERSISLAESLFQKHSNKNFFVFTDVFVKNEEESYELIERAKAIGAIYFKKDIVTINFAFHNRKNKINFFVIGYDESENISQALKLIANKKYENNTNLYVFSTQLESELLLTHAFESNKTCKIKVRRINEVQSLINRVLYDTGFEKIFEKAYDSGSGNKEINAIILGMGSYGTEMTKALSWYCQMDGYRIKIDSFDLEQNADSKFQIQCPELMDEKHNGKINSDGEANYSIVIHSDIDVMTKSFEDEILSLPRITYVFIALGDDSINIIVATRLRTLFERNGLKPTIQAIVYNSDKKEALSEIKNFKGQKYDIDFIGDIKSLYSEDAVLNSELENQALARHLKLGSEEEFWQYDYNYKSSIAATIHHNLKLKCGIKGINKSPIDRTEEERWAIRKLEHRRWNAYMRSEGYIYGGTTEKEGRNDLAKMHNCLVPFDVLPPKEQEKDDD